MLEVAQATYQQLKPVATPESIHRAMYAQLGRVATKQTHSQQPLWRRTGTAVGIGSVVTGIALVVATRRLRTS